MTQLVSLRASATPLALRCPGSVHPHRLLVDEHNEAADIGTAAHELLHKMAEENAPPYSDVLDTAHRYGVPPSELRILLSQGWRLWQGVCESFSGGVFGEQELHAEVIPGFTITGHVDLRASAGATRLRLGDWKTGRKDSDYSAQMRTYGALALLDDKSLEEVTITILWVRDESIENYTMDRAAATRWIKELVARVYRWDGVFHPSSYCQYCPRSHDCEAAIANARRDVAIVADRNVLSRVETELAMMSDADKLQIYEIASTVYNYADRIRKAMKAHVMQHGDVVADGKRLTITEQERRVLDTIKAWPIIEESEFTNEEIGEFVELKVSKLESAVAKRAGRGNGAAAIRSLRAKLDELDALTIKTSPRLTPTRA